MLMMGSNRSDLEDENGAAASSVILFGIDRFWGGASEL
jgi:hypothetical protein